VKSIVHVGPSDRSRFPLYLHAQVGPFAVSEYMIALHTHSERRHGDREYGDLNPTSKPDAIQLLYSNLILVRY